MGERERGIREGPKWFNELVNWQKEQWRGAGRTVSGSRSRDTKNTTEVGVGAVVREGNGSSKLDVWILFMENVFKRFHW